VPRGIHGRRDPGVRSLARLHRPPRRPGRRAMRRIKILLLAAAAGAAWSAAHAADPRYPDWPCAQAKVPELSVAAMWAGPPSDAVGDAWKSDAKVRELVARLAVRRTPLEDAEKAAEDFIVASGADKTEKAKLLFAGLFQELNQQRTEVMDGIDRITKKEKELAEEIRTDRAALGEAQDAAPPDQQKIHDLTSRLEWGTRIYEDRRKTIRYVCEVPTTIERRLFALGRAIAQAARWGGQRRPRHSCDARSRSAVPTCLAPCPRGHGGLTSLPDSSRLGRLCPPYGAGVDGSSGRSANAHPSVPSGYQATLV